MHLERTKGNSPHTPLLSFFSAQLLQRSASSALCFFSAQLLQRSASSALCFFSALLLQRSALTVFRLFKKSSCHQFKCPGGGGQGARIPSDCVSFVNESRKSCCRRSLLARDLRFGRKKIPTLYNDEVPRSVEARQRRALDLEHAVTPRPSVDPHRLSPSLFAQKGSPNFRGQLSGGACGSGSPAGRIWSRIPAASWS